jgi:CPA2 family monovalent cation:H+ antiporter-2
MARMHDLDLILTLTGGLAAALVCGYITFRLGLSPIVGYLAAGFIVGPHTPGFVANRSLADQLAEIGVVLLMFGVGLQFHVEELLAVRRVAVPGALGRSVVSTLAGTLVGVAFGWGWKAGLDFGLALSVTSTVVAMRALSDQGELHTRTGHMAVGWLVVEDLFTVLVLVLLPAVFAPGQGGAGRVVLAILVGVAKLALMVGLTAVAGKRAIPWLLDRVAATRSRELFTLTILVLALGIAVGASLLFGVSMALGAFLAGMVVGRSEFSLRAATEALPMRDAFAVLFFVSAGMLFEPRHLIAYPALVAITCAVVLVIKPLAAIVLLLLFKSPNRVAAAIALLTAQIGEFSFILAYEGQALGIVDDRMTRTLVAAAIVSITVNPILCRLTDPLARALRRIGKRPASAEGPASSATALESDAESERFRAIVVGHGPVGRTLTRLLAENSLEPVLIELNLDTVRELNARGLRAIYGDATHRDTLEQAGVATAVGLILTAAGSPGAAETIRMARQVNPRIIIVARSKFIGEHRALRKAGADVVFSDEAEVALAMTESVLQRLGATAEQIDRERARVRAELFGDAASDESSPDGRAWPEPPEQLEPSRDPRLSDV